MSSPTMIDLFCGIGGFRLALQKFGVECVFSSEINEKARESYAANFGEEPYGDITEIAVEDIPSHDILCGGFPCQSFSTAGKRTYFNDDRGNLFFEIVRIAEYHQPKMMLLENVRNILKADNGEVWRIISSEIDRIGYNLHYAVLNAADFGVPQARKRCYMVAIRKDIKATWEAPEPTDEPVCVADIMLPDDEVPDNLWVKQDIVITHLDNLDKHSNDILRVGYTAKMDGSDTTRATQGRKISSINGVAHTQMANSNGARAMTGVYLIEDDIGKKVAQSRVIASSKGVAHTMLSTEKGGGGGARSGMYLIEGDKDKSISQGRRIYSIGGCAITQMGSEKVGGGGARNGIYYLEHCKARALCNEEMKAVMGFPVEHIISEGKYGAMQCGNAVIPHMIELVFRGVKDEW